MTATVLAAKSAAPAAHVVPPALQSATTEPAWVRRTLIGVALVFLTLFLFVPLLTVFLEAFKKGFSEDPPEQFRDVRDRGKWKKGDRIYLNPREIRDARFIQPGQRIHGIAIFKNVDPRAHVYELHVSGLVDIVKITAVTEDEWKMEYEPQTLKIRYERQGELGLFYWVEPGCGYAIVGPLPRETLLALAQAIERQEPAKAIKP